MYCLKYQIIFLLVIISQFILNRYANGVLFRFIQPPLHNTLYCLSIRCSTNDIDQSPPIGANPAPVCTMDIVDIDLEQYSCASAIYDMTMQLIPKELHSETIDLLMDELTKEKTLYDVELENDSEYTVYYLAGVIIKYDENAEISNDTNLLPKNSKCFQKMLPKNSKKCFQKKLPKNASKKFKIVEEIDEMNAKSDKIVENQKSIAESQHRFRQGNEHH